jgi:hypothetical protein
VLNSVWKVRILDPASWIRKFTLFMGDLLFIRDHDP